MPDLAAVLNLPAATLDLLSPARRLVLLTAARAMIESELAQLTEQLPEICPPQATRNTG